jgi:hypothetical protein
VNPITKGSWVAYFWDMLLWPVNTYQSSFLYYAATVHLADEVGLLHMGRLAACRPRLKTSSATVNYVAIGNEGIIPYHGGILPYVLRYVVIIPY